ncbi:hypothetical protein AB0D10_40865 [Kitasatospora sp. NPDC048545]|uniref:hypothetical protein n=1 Tax=Kitasatospora sp. NPDC048545 TaxID=3157208 RepID=UPI0034041D44
MPCAPPSSPPWVRVCSPRSPRPPPPGPVVAGCGDAHGRIADRTAAADAPGQRTDWQAADAALAGMTDTGYATSALAAVRENGRLVWRNATGVAGLRPRHWWARVFNRRELTHLVPALLLSVTAVGDSGCQGHPVG